MYNVLCVNYKEFLPVDNPCSYIVYWFPVTDDGLYGEKIISKVLGIIFKIKYFLEYANEMCIKTICL